jgi:hypothetical protein
MDVRDYGLRKMYVEKRKTPAGDVGWGLAGMFLSDGDDVLCRTSVLHCEDQRIGIFIFLRWMLRIGHTIKWSEACVAFAQLLLSKEPVD